eukprot:8670-Heterococcus_DN1.PRE.2
MMHAVETLLLLPLSVLSNTTAATSTLTVSNTASSVPQQSIAVLYVISACACALHHVHASMRTAAAAV